MPPGGMPPALPVAAPPRRRTGLTFDQRLDIFGAVLFFLGLALTFALFSRNSSAVFGVAISLIRQFFGVGSFGAPIFMMVVGLWILVRHFGDRLPRIDPVRVLGGAILFVVTLGFFHVFLRPVNATESYALAEAGRGGGYIGALILETFYSWFGWLGAILTLIAIGLAGVIMLAGWSTRELYDAAVWLIARMRGQQPPGPPFPLPEAARQANQTPAAPPEPTYIGGPPEERPLPMHPPVAYSPASSPPAASSHAPQQYGPPPADTLPTADGGVRTPRRPSRPTTSKQPATPTAPEPVVAGSGAPTSAYAAQPIVIGGEQPWVLPNLPDILDEGTEVTLDDQSFRTASNIIEETLSAFGAPGRVVEVNRGPTITQFGVEPEYITQRNGKKTKVKVSKIASLADDLALALSAPSIRIEAPVPGKGYVGIEVPNPESALVSLRDVMESPAYARTKSKSQLALALGQDVAGQAIVADLTAMPHLLIAGTTGSGKSVCVNAIIAALLLTNTPDDLKFLMVDPKRVELTAYKNLPHLLVDVVVDLERVVGSLQWVAREMTNRYSRFSETGVRNISEFNRRALANKEKKMPYLIVVIDELADLMMLAPEETEKTITRLAQMARATGIHLILATQRPSVDVVTGLIKANFPARISFAVASSVDSRVILDAPGAEKLLGRGDMLFMSPESPAPVRLQGVYVSDKEISRLVRYWKGAYVDVPAPTVELPPITTTPAATLPPAAAPPRQPGKAPARPAGPNTLEQIPLWHDTTLGTAASKSAGAPPSNPFSASSHPATPANIPVMSSMLGKPKDDEDDLYHEAVDAVREMRKASISLLQRRLRIGYTRAARLIDLMEERGIVGPAKTGAAQREVIDYGDGARTPPGYAPAAGAPTPPPAPRPTTSAPTTTFGDDDAFGSASSLHLTSANDDEFDFNQDSGDGFDDFGDFDDDLSEEEEDEGGYLDV